MTPAARIQTAIELLEAVESQSRPADRVVASGLRARRYAGAKDRRAIRDRVFATLRARARLDWLIERHGGAPAPRARVIAALVADGQGPEDLAALFDGTPYGPAPLDEEETRLAAALADNKVNGRDTAEMPRWVRGNYPAWLEEELIRAFGADLDAEMAGLDTEAPLDLRVNEAKARRDEVLAAFRSFGFETAPTLYSPLGLRLTGRPRVTDHPLYRDGTVEIQDEGAQLAALLVDAAGAAGAASVECVVDYCAGGGGKTLALAARMAGRGRLIACDISARRLDAMTPRRARAGADTIEIQVVAEEGDPWVAAQAGLADRVLVDLPCSGTGRWRRDPDARWTLTPDALAGFVDQQRAITAQAASLVKPGGRLITATCSVLPSENQDQAAWFTAQHPAFRPVPVAEVWRDVLGGEMPGADPCLQLTPHRHGMDAFFIAIFERTA